MRKTLVLFAAALVALTVSPRVGADPTDEALVSGFVGAARTAQQDAPFASERAPSTKLAAALLQHGPVLVQDVNNLGNIQYSGKAFGNVASVLVPLAISVHPLDRPDDKTKGLMIALGSDAGIEECLLDYDEVKALSQALQGMSGLAKDWATTDVGVKSATFSSAGGFHLTLVKDRDGKEYVYATCQNVIRTTHQFKEVNNLDSLKTLVDAGIQWLDKE